MAKGITHNDRHRYASKMRTTVRLSEDLLAEAKSLAVRIGRTLTSVIEEGVRRVIAASAEVRSNPPPELPVSRASGWPASRREPLRQCRIARPDGRPGVILPDANALVNAASVSHTPLEA